MIISVRCIFLFIAIMTIVEVIVFVLVLAGNETFESILFTFLDEESIEAVKIMREQIKELSAEFELRRQPLHFDDDRLNMIDDDVINELRKELRLDPQQVNQQQQQQQQQPAETKEALEQALKELFSNLENLKNGKLGGAGGGGAVENNKDQQEQQQEKEGKKMEEASNMNKPSAASSSSSTTTAIPVATTEYHAINKRFVKAVLSLDHTEASRMLQNEIKKGVDVNYADLGEGNLLFRLCAKQKESPAILNMVDILLASPSIDPNDDTGSWSPLKSAMAMRNTGCTQKILDHTRTVPLVHAAGLSCDLVKMIDSRVAVVLAKDTPSCFGSAKHFTTTTESSDLVSTMRAAKQKIKANINLYDRVNKIGRFAFEDMNRKTHTTNVGNAKGSASSTQQKANTQTPSKKKRTTPWKLVLDPTEFESAFEFVWFYFIGRDWVDSSWYVKALIFGVVAHSLLVVGACGFYLHTMEDNEKAGIMPDVITPPATPQFGAAAAPQQNQENNLALPAAAVERREEGEQEGAQAN